MTVAELRQALDGMPDHAEVRFASSPSDNIAILSVYRDIENPSLVWIDIDFNGPAGE